MPASDWRQVRKDLAGPAEVTKAVTSDTVAESGKTPPAHIAGREFPGTRVKVPPIDDTADTAEELTLPRKAGACKCTEMDKCNCNTIKDKAEAMYGMKPEKCSCSDVKKCACNTAKEEDMAKAEEPAAPVPAPTETVDTAKVEKDIAPYKQPDKPGVMLALALPPELAQKLHQAGGMKPDDMHVTLGYYGKLGEHVDEAALDAMRKCVVKEVQGYKPIKAAIGGLGRFTATKSSDNKDVLVGLVDSPDLHDVRDAVIAAVSKCSNVTKDGEEPAPSGPTPFKNHGYTPHITLGYIDPEDKLSVHKLDRDEFTFTHMIMQVGKEKTLLPLGERQNMAKSIWMPIVKADDDQRLATGIVLEPEVVDAQGDIIAATVIRQAAHNFLALYNKKTQLGLQHDLMKPDGVELVESWIAPVDMVMNNRMIKAGTWMMTVRVNNDALWNRIKTGQLGGFSIGGVARVQKLAL